jgi:DNA-binding phage protein
VIRYGISRGRRYVRGTPWIRGPQLHGHARRVAAAETDAYRRRLAQKIRDARLERGVAVSEIAAATGLAECAIHRAEKGERGWPEMLTIVRIARALDMQPYELIP